MYDATAMTIDQHCDLHALTGEALLTVSYRHLPHCHAQCGWFAGGAAARVHCAARRHVGGGAAGASVTAQLAVRATGQH